MPDPNDPVMIKAFELAPIHELHHTLAKLRKRSFRAAALKKQLDARIAAEKEAQRLPNRIKAGLRRAFASIMPRVMH